ncbi:MAG TPA: hypothetical protein VIM34_08965, partial [Burkholderiaceae bacterium]
MNLRRLGSMPGLALAFVVLSFVLPLGRSDAGSALRWTSFAPPFVFASCAMFAALLAVLRTPRSPLQVLLFAVLGGLAALAPLLLLAVDLGATLDAASWRAGFW